MAIEFVSLENRMCTGKAKHTTHQKAQYQLNAGKKKNFASKGIKMSVYVCEFCGFYHVGNTTKKNK